MTGSLGGGGVLRRGQGRRRSRPLRGQEVGRLAPLRHPMPARPCLPGRRSACRPRRRPRQKGDLDPGLIPPTVPEVRRLVLAMAEPEGRRRFLLGWSAWRRAHQAVAARCRAAKRVARHALGRKGPLKTAVIVPEEARLTDEQWALVRPLLPLQRSGIGRPPNDHRAVLGGILWVARTGSSWRAETPEYGDCEQAYWG